MKVFKFLNSIEKIMIYDNTINNNSLIKFIKEFKNYMNQKELNKYNNKIDSILFSTKKQKTIDTIVKQMKVDELENNLNFLKKDDLKT